MKRHLSIFAAAAAATVLCLASSCLNRQQPSSATHFAEDALRPYVESGELPGAISVLYKDGKEEICCIGCADTRSGRKITMDDIYMQCSQTKGFCGVTLAQLIEKGMVDLDDPVSKYLPEFETLWVEDKSDDDNVRTFHKAHEVLTIRMCLNHTGGFPFETSAKRSDVRGGGWSGGAPLRQNASIAAASPLLFEPGTSIMYSNTGIDIAAAVLEEVTGMKWEDYLKKNVLDPLGMTSSSFRPTDRQLRGQIEMYSCHEGEPAQWQEEDGNQQRPYNDNHVFASAGAGLWVTASDQVKFYKMLMNLGMGDNGVRILKEETVRNLLAVSSRPEGFDGYSLGLHAPSADTEDSWFGHGGAWGTNCLVNYHKKMLKMWVVQLTGGPRPWDEAMEAAAEKFFE